MVSNHLTESGPIIASLYVVGYHCPTTISHLQILYLTMNSIQPTWFNSNFDFWDYKNYRRGRYEHSYSFPENSSVALLWSSCSGSKTLSSSIVLPLEPFKRNFSRETGHSYRQTFVFGYCGKRNTQSFPWGNQQRHTNPILVVNNLHMHRIPKSYLICCRSNGLWWRSFQCKSGSL